MSRKTAVCVLFVLLASIIGFGTPAEAVSSPAEGLRAIAAGQDAVTDPDGLAAPDSGFTSVLYVVRVFLASFVL